MSDHTAVLRRGSVPRLTVTALLMGMTIVLSMSVFREPLMNDL